MSISLIKFDKPLLEQRFRMKLNRRWNIICRSLRGDNVTDLYFDMVVCQATDEAEVWESHKLVEKASCLHAALKCRLYIEGYPIDLPDNIPRRTMPWMLQIAEAINCNDVSQSVLDWMAVCWDIPIAVHAKLEREVGEPKPWPTESGLEPEWVDGFNSGDSFAKHKYFNFWIVEAARALKKLSTEYEEATAKLKAKHPELNL